MVYAFDTLSFTKRLEDAGIPREQAEAHAEAARQFIMAELVTKPDLAAVKNDIAAVKADLTSAMDTQTLRLTVRFGGMLVIGIGVLAAILKLVP